jgi:4-amino-4-deoxy-L-arabinose transferase-like glycosyltransferase
MGVATVGVLYATVRRWFGPAAGLLAGAALALTPVATLMFRFNNPDALLTLTLAVAAYATVRAVERAGTGWLALAAAAVGVGFLTKMLQALLVVPALAGAYLLAAPTRLRSRVGQLTLAGVVLVATGGWWVAIVQLVPASMRPYIGGSQTNSALELILGYNGFGRLTGDETGSVGGAPGGGWGPTSWARLLGAEVGGQVAWLLPAALIALGAGLWLTRRAPRTDRTRAALVLWGGWLLVTGLVFSFMRGIFHAYYAVALAPAIAALVGIGAVTLWRRRGQRWAALTLAATTLWSVVLLGRSSAFQPWLRPAVLLAGFAAAAGLLALGRVRLPARAGATVAAVGLVAALAGPAAYAFDTAATPHAGAIPSAGPAVAGARFGPGGGPGGAFGRGRAFGQGGLPGLPPGGFPGGASGGGQPQGGFPGGVGGGQAGGGGPGGMGGLLNGSRPSAELVALLEQDAGHYTWVAATVGANNAAGYQLATGDPVMPIGGFNGSDPAPTLAQFQQDVRDGRIHYFIGGDMPGGDSGTAQQIAAWVADHFTATTVGGVTVYDLTASTATN